ncbi:hypothetical protein DB35_15815 [Streptomyces abyssalis]|uniref:Phage shock protein PspC N-terminal domain-containing protein n=1 Tax=Streptomyces abyssalis TaxID=933944 RepID=A0A1E7JIF2_9ACTN|nr:hypothetical protein AN215_22205 [Streptomyces abyssalis]OEU91523.1 hypothetical protein DB35_15815 [Streptomyces abyssalis]
MCSGLGRHFDLDPVIFRVPLVVLSLLGGLGLVFYGAAWLLIPAEDERQNEARWLLSGRVEGTTLSAILVALVGCGLFLASLGSRSTPFSLLLVAAVAGAAYWSLHRREAEAAEAVGAPVDPTTAHAVADAPPEAQAPPVPGMPSWWREPLTKDGTGAPSGTGYLWGPADAESPEDVLGPPGARSRWAQHPGRRQCGRAAAVARGGGRRERSFGGFVAMLASVGAVAGAAPGWDSRPLGTSLTVGLACALAVYGIGFAVSAFVGRIGFGTVFLTVVTAVMLAGAALIPKSIGTDWREVTWAPATAADVSRTYELDGGAAELDLSGLRSAGERETVRTAARLGAGSLKVVVPSGTRVELEADVGAGEIRLPERTGGEGDDYVVESIGGVGTHERLTLPSATGKKGGTLELSADVTVGQLEIVRLLPSGERTDHLPVNTVPREEPSEVRP